jgi:predicted ATPase/DNA-binding CsgD family transcriptional regulator/DNA-binding XRE family transcriptional regulator
MPAPVTRLSLLPVDEDTDDLANEDERSLGALLRRYRSAARLSQQALAERAGLSAHAITALERGARRAAYPATVRALATALGLSGAQRATLEAAVPRSRKSRAAVSAPEAPAPVPLPLLPTRLLGRAQELATVHELLGADAVRLLTLTGPAGVGKTRLALEVASELQDAFPDGVYFVDLAPLRDPALLLPTIARALAVFERGGASPLAGLQAHLKERELLLVLDNFEQVRAAAPQVAELLTECPSVKILVTSRTRLRLRWEHALPLAPLPVPDPDAPPTVEVLAALPAVRLFVERARASNLAFALTPQNAAAVAALCRHLQGLPLALELAAARANVLTPAEMLAWVEQRPLMLSWDSPDLPARQQSLRAALEWSYTLLAPAEQALLRRLAVFPDGWTLEAAAAVAQEALGLDPLGGVSALVDASLVCAGPGEDGAPRFQLLGATREFAAEQLAASGELDTVRRQHAAYYVALAEGAASALGGAQQETWFHRLQQEHDNLRLALGWAAEHGDAETELRLAGSLAYFWWVYGYLREGWAWLEDALAQWPVRDDALRLRALEGAGLLAAQLGEDAAATARLEEALALARALGDARHVTSVLGVVTLLACLQGQSERWPALAAELDAARPAGEPGNLFLALHGLGLLAHEAGDQAAATAYLEEALARHQRVGDQSGVAAALATRAAVAQAQGERARAADLIREALELARAGVHPVATAWCAHVAVHLSAERAPAAVLGRLLGGVDAQRATASLRLSPYQRARYDRLATTVRAAVGEDAFAAGWAGGRALTRAGLVEAALAALEFPGPAEDGTGMQPPQRKPRARDLLSPREQEVLALVAAGLTNEEIAGRLIISPSTARYHVASLLNKLGAGNRTQAVAHAAHQNLL